MTSWSSALHIACLALDIGKRDIVWTSAISFVASANCALYCGAKIDFIDIDPIKCSRASENLDVIVVEGNGASPNTLNEAAVGDADYVLCLTRVDEVNLIASQQAHKLGANRIIARLRNQQYTTQDSIIRPEKFGVDIVIHPERAACEEITRLVKHPYALQVMDFEAGRLTMLGLTIDKERKDIDGISLGEIARNNSHFRFAVIAVLRGRDTIVPSAEFIFEQGDIGYFIIKTQDIQNQMTLLCKELTITKRVMIIGGSKIGRTLAKELPKESFNTRLVEYKKFTHCLLYTSPSPRDRTRSRMPSSA